MDRAAFDAWFIENLDRMVALGVMHPNSPAGKTVHLALSSVEPRLADLQARIEALEGKGKRKRKSPDG